MTLIIARDSVHDFIVKFSPSVCVAEKAKIDRTPKTATPFFVDMYMYMTKESRSSMLYR